MRLKLRPKAWLNDLTMRVFPQTWHAFNQDVATGEKCSEDFPDGVAMTDNHTADFFLNRSK